MTGSFERTWQHDERSACTNATEPRPKLGPAPGVLTRLAGVENGRFHPSAGIEAFVEHYWWVRWDVARPRVAEVLSYPSVHVVFESETARVTGVVRGKFTRAVEGRGEVFAVKFRPGMFRPWSRVPAFQLTNRTIALAGELGTPGPELARALLALPTAHARAQLLDRLLCAAAPAPQPDAVLARDLVSRMRADPSLRTVSEVGEVSGLTMRALQRLFREYVGVSPKWVVSRFRLQEAAEQLKDQGQTIASVAAGLGYFDQAHFVRDFKACVGCSPLDYRRKYVAPAGRE